MTRCTTARTAAVSTLSRVLRSAVLLLAALTLVGCQSPIDEEPDAGPPPSLPSLRLLVAGDSLADGYYASEPDRGFAPLLVEALSARASVTPVIVAVAGARAFRVAADVETTTLGVEPFDLAVLEVGANDVGTSTIQDWRDGYVRLLAAVEATSPEAEVVCLGPWNAPRASRPYEAVVRRLCRSHLYLGLSDLFATEGLRGTAGRDTGLGTSDVFHPDDRGHAAIAQRIEDAIDG